MSDKYSEYPQYDSGEVASPMDDMSETGYGRGYRQGRRDATGEFLYKIEKLRQMEFMTIANTTNRKLDGAYGEITRALNWLEEQIKGEDK